MKVALSLALLAATSALAAKASLSSVQRVTNLGNVPNKFIVEFTQASEIPTKRSLGTPHELLYRIQRSRIFIGASLFLNNTQDVANILQTEGVLAIRPVRTFPRPVPVFSKQVSPGDPGLPDSESTHITTGVDKLHAKGITGKGIRVGIIDTGTDYTHPFLGGGFGPGFKVAGGFDLVGDAYTGANTPMPDPDPLDQYTVRTHVAGIVGANPGNEFNISGVAYGATIFSYRIFGCTGDVQDDVIVDALLMGVKDGMDILTMSLGGADGWTEGTGSVVSSRIAASGKIVTIAAGNDGASGAWFTSGPGTAIDAISVASSDNTVIPLQSLTVSGVTHDPIVYYDVRLITQDLSSSGRWDPPLYVTSNDTTVVDDACNPLPASTPDLSGFVVLVRRGTCTFVTKLTNIAAFGGNTTLIYDNGNGFGAISVGNFSAVLIQAEDGVFLADQFAAGAHISVSFPQSGSGVQFPAPTGGLVSTFTSYGPTEDMFFKPAITAPGGNILSTFPVPLGSWALDSGTSMATPFMAGSAALLLSVKGKSLAVATGARTLFQTTAKPISSSLTDGDPFQTVTQQGAGLVQVFDAIFGTTTLSRAELLLNDTAHFAGPQRFTVKNTGPTIKTYTLSHVPAGPQRVPSRNVSLIASETQHDAFVCRAHPSGPRAPRLSTDFATVTFNSAKFTLPPGQSHNVVATITPPRGLDATTSQCTLASSSSRAGTIVHATYLGVAASLKPRRPSMIPTSWNPQDGVVNYTFVGGDAPTVLWRQTFGTPLLLLDLVESDVKLSGTLNRRGGPIEFTSPHAGGGSFAGVPTVGRVADWWLGRNDQRSLVILTYHPYPALFARITALLGPLFQQHGLPMLEAACHNMGTWCVVCTKQGLTLRPDDHRTRVPGRRPEHRAPVLAGAATARGQGVRPATAHPRLLPPIHPPPLLLFEAALPHLWSLWECLVLSEPLLVFGASPAQTSQAVWWLRDLLRPLPLTGDIRPYFTIHDTDHAVLAGRLPPAAGRILGVTNPVFERACAHWPHVLSLGRNLPLNTATHGASAGNTRARAGPAPGWKTRTHTRYVSKDRALLRRLEDVCASGSERERLDASLDLRRHFHARTTEMLVPLSRYLHTLIPTPTERASASASASASTLTVSSFASASSSKTTASSTSKTTSTASSSSKTASSSTPKPPEPLRMRPPAFLASLKTGAGASLKTGPGAALPFRTTARRKEFYERWLRTPAFGVWLGMQEGIVQGVLDGG
ncbi:hypothetical protein B0H12DRAFT_1229565 [Mycena haematopus]|nr:hypothetical protein B0H12DRAFT_1229565 [Mycena haematopus]